MRASKVYCVKPWCGIVLLGVAAACNSRQDSNTVFDKLGTAFLKTGSSEHQHAYLSDHRFVTVDDGRIRFWNLVDHTEIPNPVDGLKTTSATPFSSDDGNILAFWAGERIEVADIQRKKILGQFEGFPQGAKLSSDGSMLAGWSSSSKLGIVELSKTMERKNYDAPKGLLGAALFFSNDATKVFTYPQNWTFDLKTSSWARGAEFLNRTNQNTVFALSTQANLFATYTDDTSTTLEIQSSDTSRSIDLAWKPVTDLALSATAKFLALSYQDGDLEIRRLSDGQIIAQKSLDSEGKQFHTPVAFLGESRVLCRIGSSLKVWNLPEFVEEKTIALAERPNPDLYFLAPSGNGKLLAVADREEQVDIYDTSTWAIVRSIPIFETRKSASEQLYREVFALSFEGERLLMAGDGDKLWIASSDRFETSYPMPDTNGKPFQAWFDPEGKGITLAFWDPGRSDGHDTLQEWHLNLETGAWIKGSKVPIEKAFLEHYRKGSSNTLVRTKYEPRGRLDAYEGPNGKSLWSRTVGEGKVTRLTIGQDEIAIAFKDRPCVERFRARTGDPIPYPEKSLLGPVIAIAIDATGSNLAATSSSLPPAFKRTRGDYGEMFDLATGQVGTHFNTDVVAFLNGGLLCISADALVLKDPKTGTETKIRDCPEGYRVQSVRTKLDRRCVAFLEEITVEDREDWQITVVDSSSWKPKFSAIHTAGTTDYAIGDDGETLYLLRAEENSDQKRIEILEERGKKRRSLSFANSDRWLRLFWNSKLQRLIVFSLEGSIHLINPTVSTIEKTFLLAPENEGPFAWGDLDLAAISPDQSQALILGPKEGQVRFLRLADGQITKSFDLKYQSLCGAFAPSGDSAWIGCGDGVIRRVK